MYLFQPFVLHNPVRFFAYLHSTMYLFQPGLVLGSIATALNLHSTMYLFQHLYGSEKLSCKGIYIPLCIYFNAKALDISPSYLNLHSTMYLFQRFDFFVSLRNYWNLHSTMYLFQLVTWCYEEIKSMYLHSTMYLFQPKSSEALYLLDWSLHFCRPSRHQLCLYWHVPAISGLAPIK